MLHKWRSLFIFNFEKATTYTITKSQVIAFVLIFVISFIALEGINRKFFVEENASSFTILNGLKEQKKDIEILFIGDSHVNVDIVPRLSKYKICKLGFGGTSYIPISYLLERYIDQMPALKLVVLETDLVNFNSLRINWFQQPYFWNRFLDFEELEQLKGKKILMNKFKILTLTDVKLGRIFFINNLICLLLGKKYVDYFDTRKWPLRKIHNRTSNAEEQFKNHKIPDEHMLFYFRKILNRCLKNNIPLVTIQFPLSSEFLQGASKYIDMDHYKKTILFNDSYSKYIYKRLDYEKLFIDHPDYFDVYGDHLVGDSREIFSKILFQDIEEILNTL